MKKSNSSDSKRFFQLTLSGLLVLFWMCRAPLQYGNGKTTPSVRVGIMERQDRIEFQLNGAATLYDPHRDISFQGQGDGRWRVEIVDSKPAEISYRLTVGITTDRSKAHEIVRYMKKRGLRARVESRRRSSQWTLPYLSPSVHQVFLEASFKTEDAARSYQKSIHKKTGSEIVEIPVRESRGTLRFTNLKTKSTFESKRPVRVTAAEMKVFDVEVGVGFHWEAKENQQYGGNLEFLVDHIGSITLINEAPLEEYLKGVVPSEMPIGFPIEALKAQAIAARVEAASKIDVRHPFQPFDLCDDVHCQVYSGVTKLAESTDRAIKNTRGIFMVHGDQIIEAFYAGVCGGHTENNDNVWLTDSKPYLRGIQDGRSGRRRLALEQEKNVRAWIDRFPTVFCNTLSQNVPEFLNYSKKYFRWEQILPRKELQETIRQKTGEDFGNLLDLVPRRRGVSGRVLELEVIGSRKRFTIDRELSIRQTLSETTLFSSCFYVKKVGTSGLPSKFVIKGAGWGHGVGMCQVGAAVMADSGAKFDQILKHYYRRVSLQLLYN